MTPDRFAPSRMDTETLLDDICSPDPKRAAQGIQVAGTQRDTLLEGSLARLRAALEQPINTDTNAENSSPVFLAYLLAAWKETRAHPLLVSILRLPEDPLDRILGDVITEDASTILADTYPGEARFLHTLVYDKNAYGFARGAGLKALSILTYRGSYDRTNLSNDFTALAATFDPESESDQITAAEVVSCLLDLRMWELRGLALRLYDRGVVDETIISREEVEEKLIASSAFHQPDQSLTHTITDAWEAVAKWDFFSPRQPSKADAWPLVPQGRLPLPPVTPERVLHDGSAYPAQPYLAPVKPGRNDPCSCGSGKKYKKCCGA